MCYMQTVEIKIDKHFCKNLGLYGTEGLGSDGSVVKVYRNNIIGGNINMMRTTMLVKFT